jgi:hypothetical protein
MVQVLTPATDLSNANGGRIVICAPWAVADAEAAFARWAHCGLFFCEKAEHHGAKETANEAEVETRCERGRA